MTEGNSQIVIENCYKVPSNVVDKIVIIYACLLIVAESSEVPEERPSQENPAVGRPLQHY